MIKKQKAKKMTLEDLAVRIDKKIDSKIDKSIGDLAIKVQEGFMATAKDLLSLTERVKSIEERLAGYDKEFGGIHSNFDIVFTELKSIRERLDRIEKNDTSAEVINLDLRVKKLEKKAGLK